MLNRVFCSIAPYYPAKAVKWWLKAAEQGDGGGMYSLGCAFEEGLGVPKDYPQAYMWYNLASTYNSPIFAKNRDLLEKKMTPLQIEEGQRLTREWIAKHPTQN